MTRYAYVVDNGCVPDIGELVKERRLRRNWSLRQLGSQIGVTPAYVADIEAARRLPSAELKDRIAAVLEIPAEELAAADTRLTADLRDWIEERPQLTSLLRSLRESPESEMFIHRLSRIINRRSPRRRREPENRDGSGNSASASENACEAGRNRDKSRAW